MCRPAQDEMTPPKTPGQLTRKAHSLHGDFMHLAIFSGVSA